MFTRNLARFSAEAFVPEHLPHYVQSVSDLRPVICGDCIAYTSEDALVLIGYPPGSVPIPASNALPSMHEAIEKAFATQNSSGITVLGPDKPRHAPKDAASRADVYWFLPLPMPVPSQKLRNLLKNARKNLFVRPEEWQQEHAAMVEQYIRSRPLEEGTRRIYKRLEHYVGSSQDTILLAARAKDGNALLGFCIADFSSLHTAFYMFAFRTESAPPGTADALVASLAHQAEEKGYKWLNMGLGINAGICFFKKKWKAQPLIPCTQSTWVLPEKAPHTYDDAGSTPPTLSQISTQERDIADPITTMPGPSVLEGIRHLFNPGGRPLACIQVEVTSICPGRCTYCPHTTKKDSWRSRHMDDTTFAALRPLLLQTNRVHLQGWGEPLLHPRFFDLTAAARRMGCAVSTTTYGLSITPSVAKKIVTSGMDIVALSLAGVDEHSNCERQGIPFAKVHEAIDNLHAAKQKHHAAYPDIHLAYLMLASRMDDVCKLPGLMQSWGVTTAVVSTLDYIAAPGMETEAFAGHETAKIAVARTLLQNAKDDAEHKGLTLHYSLPGPSGATTCNENIHNCLYVDAEGQLSPCIYVNLPTNEDDPCRRVYGKATETDPLRIWHSKPFKQFRNALASGSPDTPCVTCAKRFERMW